ncbi:hypothetical protein [Curtobacterium sp. MCBA15_004]|uniref:hypothetical protein n=1 Tax=unclassified Curtobacterium TaxID=257496 RepID=UPI0008DCFB42|nr:hypothetical protein [Curtobacterium sp. MCBA15_004]WIA98388.1 hypothetical protein QOL16_08390 [Curtobacterium sp. MCBA15_004]
MTTLTRRERERRTAQLFNGAFAVLLAVATVVLHREIIAAHPLDFWLPTVAGLAYGAVAWRLGRDSTSAWFPLLPVLGWVAGVVLLARLHVAAAPAWGFAVMIGAFAVTAAFPKRPAPRPARKVASTEVRPWTGSGVTAVPTEHDLGRRSAHAVSVRTGSATSTFLVSDLAAFVDAERQIADSAPGAPLMFLARAGVASSDSIIGEVTTDLPDGTVFLHAGGEGVPPAAVLSEDDARTFEDWVRSLPED